MTLPALWSRSRTHNHPLQMTERFHTPVDILLLHLLSPSRLPLSHPVTPPRPLCSVSHLFSLSLFILFPIAPLAAPLPFSFPIIPAFCHLYNFSFFFFSRLLHLTQSRRISRVNKADFFPSIKWLADMDAAGIAFAGLCLCACTWTHRPTQKGRKFRISKCQKKDNASL